MSARSEVARDPWAWLVLVGVFGIGGTTGQLLGAAPAAPVPTVAVTVERYYQDRREILEQLQSIQAKLDRAIERGLVR